MNQNKNIQRFYFTKNYVLTYQTFGILLNLIIWLNCKASGLIAIIASSEKSNKQYGYMAQTIRNVQKVQSICVHLQIGHTRMILGYLMAKEEPPSCTTCGTFITIKRIILKCRQINEISIQQELPETLYEILSSPK